MCPIEDLVFSIQRIDRAIVGNSGAKALSDVVLHDAYARPLGIPVATLLGGRIHGSHPTDASIPFAQPDDAAAQMRAAVGEEYPVIKVRVGMGLENDEARLFVIREAIDEEPGGGDVILAADASGAWRPKEGVRTLRRWERYRLGHIEQPKERFPLELYAGD